MIVIDGYRWPVPCDIEREAEMTPSSISGMMLDRSYFNDVLGTFMRYDVTLAVPPELERRYSALYETLTDPVDGHTFTLPHGQSKITVTGRVESVKDRIIYTVSHKQYWMGISFSIIANHPTKKETLEGVLARGRSELPPQSALATGSTYILTNDGWYPYETQEYPNGDEVRY